MRASARTSIRLSAMATLYPVVETSSLRGRQLRFDSKNIEAHLTTGNRAFHVVDGLELFADDAYRSTTGAFDQRTVAIERRSVENDRCHQLASFARLEMRLELGRIDPLKRISRCIEIVRGPVRGDRHARQRDLEHRLVADSDVAFLGVMRCGPNIRHVEMALQDFIEHEVPELDRI